MGSLILISGSNGSGKSLYAEGLIAQTRGTRYYIATMRPCTTENHERIEKHRMQRQGLHFQTLECPYQIGAIDIPADAMVLLEDVSNLLANAMFEKGMNMDAVFQDICTLLEKSRILVAVTISGLENCGYDVETASYIESLNTLNQKLFEKADAAIHIQDHQPVYRKGDHYDFS